jgi:hypothetical protein
MIKIEHAGPGLKVTVSDPPLGRYSVKARNGYEAMQAVGHYYNVEHDRERCPMCAEVKR